jgi:hypothetical protein
MEAEGELLEEGTGLLKTYVVATMSTIRKPLIVIAAATHHR